jgi:hypothetical protein
MRKVVLVGLEVDVARAAADGVDEGLVDHLDDRGLVGFGLELGEVVVVLVRLDDVDGRVVGQGDVLDDLLDPQGIGGAVVFVDGVDDPGLGGDDRLDAEAGPEADVLDDLEVGRVDHGQGQEGPDAVDGHDHVFLGHVRGDEADDLGVDLELVEVDVRVAELAAQGLGDVLLGQVAELDERGPDGQAVLLLEFEGGAQLIGREDLLSEE